MKLSKEIVALIGGGLMLAVVTSLDAQAPSTTHKVRRANFGGESVPLESQLIQGDEIVVFQRIESPPLIVIREGTTASSELARFRRQAEAVVLGEVVSIAGELTPDRSWVRTKVSFRSIEAFKDAKEFAPVGKTAIFEYDGGEVGIKNVIVRAGTYPLLRPGDRYVLFLSKNPDKGHWYSSIVLEVTADGRLKVPEIQEGRANSPIDGMPLFEALAILRERPR